MANPFDTASDLQWGTRSAFRGAEYHRLSADRWVGVNHPNTEVRYALGELRARARDLVRNNDYAEGVVSAVADNILGWSGMQLRPEVKLPSGEPNRAANVEILRGWNEWGDEYATVDGIESWFETERLVVRNWVTDGEVFLRHRHGWDNPFGYAVEMVDPDLVDENLNEKREQTGREIVMGVELDVHGRPVAYHVLLDHPDTFGSRKRHERIDASEIVHLFARYRPGQTRGYSMFAPVLTTVEMIDGLTEAELVASRFHASKMGFITNNSDEALQAYATRLKYQNEAGKERRPRNLRMSPGTLPELDPGQDVVPFDPNHPNDAFEAFLAVLHRGVARAFGMSYLTFSGDVGAANYSSMRAGLTPERDHWRVLQRVLSHRTSRPVYRAWIGQSLLNGALALRSPVPSRYYAVTWRGRRWQWVDPKNDLEALEREIALGINSRQRAASDRGLEFRKVIDETSEDLEYAGEKDVDVSGLGAKNPTDQTPPTDEAPPASKNGNGRGHAHRLAPFVHGETE